MLTSIIIPSRNEPYLTKTIQDLILKATGKIQIIAVLDGYWQKLDEYVDNPCVTYLHFSQARGMRGAINAGVAIARGDYILKTDAHCMFGQGYDEILAKDCDYDWVVVPRRYALDPVKWEKTNNPKYPVDYMYLSKDLHGVIWKDRDNDPKHRDIKVDDLMSSQGSVWYMRKTYYKWLELMDEKHYGKFSSEFQEVGLKAWLSGGEVKVNKNTWYAHWHKTEGRGYSLPSAEFEKGNLYALNWLTKKTFRKQRHKLKWLITKFHPVPEWHYDIQKQV